MNNEWVDWEELFLKLHYEPEHEEGITCWCRPTTTVRNGIAYIDHNEQRDILKNFISKIEQQAYERGKQGYALSENKQNGTSN